MDNARQFDVRLYRAALGETIKLELLRDGQRLVAEVPVVEKPGDPDRFASQVTPEKNLIPRLGILGIELDDEIRKLLPGLRGKVGVLVAARGEQSQGATRACRSATWSTRSTASRCSAWGAARGRSARGRGERSRAAGGA